MVWETLVLLSTMRVDSITNNPMSTQPNSVNTSSCLLLVIQSSQNYPTFVQVYLHNLVAVQPLPRTCCPSSDTLTSSTDIILELRNMNNCSVPFLSMCFTLFLWNPCFFLTPTTQLRFLQLLGFDPPFNMLSPVRLSSVCLSVCRMSVVCLSSVTFVHPTQAVQIFGNISTALGTLAIHPLKISRRSSEGNPSAGGVKHKRGSQVQRFRTYRRLYLGNGARQEASQY